MISVDQCRAARALLDWSAQKLADESRIGVATVRRFETGASITDASKAAIEATLCRAGIAFIGAGDVSRDGGDGVRIASGTQR